MGSVDDRTFRVNFSDDGVANLRERVTDKLKEFMGDYTDDTLVVRCYYYYHYFHFLFWVIFLKSCERCRI